MTRATNAPASRRRRKKIIKQAKGFVGGRSKLFRTASNAVMKKLAYQFSGRKDRKRDMRGLWIMRISAACKTQGYSYSKFISALKKNGIALDRKVLAELAVNNDAIFTKLVQEVKA